MEFFIGYGLTVVAYFLGGIYLKWKEKQLNTDEKAIKMCKEVESELELKEEIYKTTRVG